MRIIICLGFLIIFLTSVGCGLFGGGGGPKDYMSYGGKKCSEISQEECDSRGTSEGSCIWNIDKCQVEPKIGEDGLPEGLGAVKDVSYAEGGLCVIDKEDQLWCFSRHSLFLMPHESIKMKQVDIYGEIGEPQVCGTKVNGDSVCFEEKGKEFNKKYVEKKGPTSEKTIMTVPGPLDSACAITKDNKLVCESDADGIEKGLVDFVNSQSSAPFDNLQMISLKFAEYSGDELNKDRVAPVFMDDQNNLSALRFYKVGKKWKFYTSPDVWSDIRKVAFYQTEWCYIGENINGVNCRDYRFPDTLSAHMKIDEIPDDVKNNEVSELAFSHDFAVAILKDGKVVKWGKKKFTKHIPKDIKAKKVYITFQHLYYLDSKSKLHGVLVRPN